MAELTIYPTQDAYIRSRGVYADARLGNGSLTSVSDTSEVQTGQEYSGGSYNVYQAFLKFDCAPIFDIPNLVSVDAVELRMYAQADKSATDFSLQWRKTSDWATLAVADWIDPTPYEALTLLCSETIAPTSGAYTVFVSSEDFVSELPDGYLYMVGCSARTLANTTPTGLESVSWYASDASESLRPCLVVSYRTTSPNTPAISAPTTGSAAAPGAAVDLTASATSSVGNDVSYQWKYSADGGAYVTIGTTSPLVASGEPDTLSWDTDGLSVGTYTLRCWALDEASATSASYDEVTYYLAYALATAPSDQSAHISGEFELTGKGYLTTTGSLRLQWEIDSANPPSDANEDYDLITSALVAQDTSVSVAGNVPQLGTWYVRARTMDTAETPNYSDWTSVLTIYVLERIMLDPGSQVSPAVGGTFNRVYCLVPKSDPLIVATATNSTVSPTYAESPRETTVFAPEGADLVAAQAIADAQLALYMSERQPPSNLRCKLEDGMKLHRGERVGIYVERLGVDLTLPIIEMTFDVSADSCEITVGDFWEPRTDQDALVAIAQKLQALEKEGAA